MAVGRSAVAVLRRALGDGGGGMRRREASPRPRRRRSRTIPAPTPPAGDLALPPGVPDRPTGPAATASRRVINDWLKALRSGHVKRAAHYFALPSKFQNATPVLTVNTEQERIAVNMSLSCGAVATEMGGAGAYTIVTFRLTKRPGGDCGTGVGGDGARRDPRRAAHDQGVVPPARRAGRPQQAPPAPSGPAA